MGKGERHPVVVKVSNCFFMLLVRFYGNPYQNGCKIFTIPIKGNAIIGKILHIFSRFVFAKVTCLKLLFMKLLHDL